MIIPSELTLIDKIFRHFRSRTEKKQFFNKPILFVLKIFKNNKKINRYSKSLKLKSGIFLLDSLVGKLSLIQKLFPKLRYFSIKKRKKILFSSNYKVKLVKAVFEQNTKQEY